MNKYLRWLGVAGSAMALLACTVMKPLTIDPTQLRSTLNRGDHVQVTTTGGQQLQFTVEEVNEQGVRGGGQNVAYGDIQNISRKQTAPGRTTLLVLGVIAVGAAAAGGGGGGSGGGGGY